ncbi:MAG TPA: hypothetical protein PK047_06550 [Saprospiraceae bacterium]|jgi:hypothetical protein|nr:hypothetical protein [Saprospiraceae bacterium]HRO08510.1 hypothetical protein [Saprospiraceae bacterium]HRP41896.1 hypothetical protein [Saprospiraceae bacterium]
MDIEKINRRHLVETDLYYRISMGLSSRLLRYENGIFHLEVTIGRKWKKSHKATASEISHIWKTGYPELTQALGCKVFIIDLNTGKHNAELIKAGKCTNYDSCKGILFSKNYLN